jgi:hypothetical protein
MMKGASQPSTNPKIAAILAVASGGCARVISGKIDTCIKEIKELAKTILIKNLIEEH